jgi:predicted phage terminase large subunit-like protein
LADQDLPYLDEDIVRMPEDIRHDLAERGKNDLYFFSKAILGYRQMTTHCHGPLCVFHDHNPKRYKLTLIPRGTFKTSVLTIGKNTQKAVRDPNVRICIINEVAENAQGFLGTIRQHFEGNRVLRALYSDVIPKDLHKNWNNQGLRLRRQWVGPEDTIEAMGIFSTLTSHHYTDLAYDDIISEDAVKSPQVMADTISRAGKFRSLMVSPSHSNLDITGTRWALHDTYSHFIKTLNRLGPQLAMYIRGAIGLNGELMFPELLDAETLAMLRDEYGDYMFSCLYMNNPRDVANQDFNVSNLRSWRWSADEESVLLYGPPDETGYPTIVREWRLDELDITVSLDPAISEAVNSDRNAIVTVGASPLGEAIVLDTFAKRCTPLEVIEHFFWLKRRYPNIRAFGIEGVAYQKSLKYFIKAECERRGVYMNIMELKALPSKRGTGNNSKFTRIRGLQPVVATGRMYTLPTQHVLRNEMADFPLGEHDDVIDALAMQLQMWRGLLSPDRLARYKASEAALIARVMASDGMPEPVVAEGPRHPRDIPHPDDLGIEIPRFRNWSEAELIH